MPKKVKVLIVSLIIISFGYTIEVRADQFADDLEAELNSDCARAVFDGSQAPAGCKKVTTVPVKSINAQIADFVVDQKVATDGLGNIIAYAKETTISGEMTKKITRADPEFANLIKNNNPDIIYSRKERLVKGYEPPIDGKEADYMMTPELQKKLDVLAELVKIEYPGLKLRVTEAWDEGFKGSEFGEHGTNSLHYEGRAVDVTLSAVDLDPLNAGDPKELGHLGALAVSAGFDWVWFENSNHIHASVKKSSPVVAQVVMPQVVTPPQVITPHVATPQTFLSGIGGYIRGIIGDIFT